MKNIGGTTGIGKDKRGEVKGRDSWMGKTQKRLLNLGKSNVTRSEQLVTESWGSCTKKDARPNAVPKVLVPG